MEYFEYYSYSAESELEADMLFKEDERKEIDKMNNEILIEK